MSGKIIYSAKLLKENTDLSEYIPGSNLVYLYDVEPRKRKIWDKRYGAYRDYNERMGLFRCKLCGTEFTTNLSGPLGGTCKTCGCKNIVYKEPNPGDRFGNLTVIENGYKIEKNYRKKYDKYYDQKIKIVRCKCDCGNESTPELRSLIIGDATSCGECYHPWLKDSYKPEIKYRCHRLGKIYDKIKTRITRPDSDLTMVSYAMRGIELRITLDRFVELFYQDPTFDPDANLQIDRIDNNGHYEEGNLRWVTPSENNRNTSKQYIFTNATVSDRLMTEQSFESYTKNSNLNKSEFFSIQFPFAYKESKPYFLYIHKSNSDKVINLIKRYIQYAERLHNAHTNEHLRFRLGVFSIMTNTQVNIDKIREWSNVHYSIRRIYDYVK